MDDRPRLTFDVPTYEFRDRFRTAFPHGTAKALMELVLTQLTELAESPDGQFVIGALLSKTITLDSSLRRSLDAYITRTSNRQEPGRDV